MEETLRNPGHVTSILDHFWEHGGSFSDLKIVMMASLWSGVQCSWPCGLQWPGENLYREGHNGVSAVNKEDKILHFFYF